ncbi:General secretion pathway protein J [Klebsiella michiganensis]|uniref:Type II secretion system protein J n=2 Tax=Klebsiella michiganensis TaxID=1134687 RepID=A0A7H4N7C8_9ENTR|nr:General secretion pathway protein J [Klebsiella michiganensis]
MIQRARGFTLVEMLLALAILAALSVAAVTVLQNVMRADTLTRDKGGRMQALQLTFSQMAADFSQIIPRRSRDSASLFFAGRFQLGSDDWAIAFSRNGWPNPLGILPRSEIQNVSYRLRGDRLERLSYDQQDPLPGSLPTVTVMQRNVQAFRLRFYASGRWQDEWQQTQTLPQGLEVTLTLEQSGGDPPAVSAYARRQPMNTRQRGVALLMVLLILALMMVLASAMTERSARMYQQTATTLDNLQAKWYALGGGNPGGGAAATRRARLAEPDPSGAELGPAGAPLCGQ